MTVKYTDKIASRGGFGSFWKLLLRWRGSVYKMVWQDLLVFLVLYYTVSFIYRFGLQSEGADVHALRFEKFVLHCQNFRNLIPISFVLGFYVSLVVGRWWGMYQSLPWPDTLAIHASTHLAHPEVRQLKTDVLRLINFTIASTFAALSPVVRVRLPSLQHFLNAGYLTQTEMEKLQKLDKKSKQHKTWVPLVWACGRLEKARQKGLITDIGYRTLSGEMLRLRGDCGSLLGWNEYNVPLVYTQVVTIAVYTFFFLSVFGEQFLSPDRKYTGHSIDFYVPVFGLLQLFFYIGWIKVAEALLNPFGADDHDFEFVPLLERHKEMTALLSEVVLDEDEGEDEGTWAVGKGGVPVQLTYEEEDGDDDNDDTGTAFLD